MPSIYEPLLQTYGRRWQWPWLALAAFLLLVGAAFLLAELSSDVVHVAPQPEAGSRFRTVLIDGLFWTADLEAGLACGLKNDRRVFVAFHAMTDCNAAVNQADIFTQADVRAAMKRYVLVMLNIDWCPDDFYHQKPGKER